MSPAIAALWILIAYFVGSISFAYLLVRFTKGVDLRTIGSGNLGATNVARALGLRAAVITYVLDFLKGLAPVLWARFGLDDPILGGVVPLSIAMAAAAYAGHCWPIYLAFRGGKGVATASGAVTALAPGAFLVAVVGFAIAVGLSRMISLGSIVAAVILPVAYLAIERHEATVMPGLAILTFLFLLTVLVLVRHRANIHRIIDGTESKIGRKKPWNDGSR